MYTSSLQVKKDTKKPFLLSGCKVQDGQGIMLVSSPFWSINFLWLFSCIDTLISALEADLFFLCLKFILAQVTGVGVNTEWGQVMASVSEDNGEETPLQVFEWRNTKNIFHFKLWLCWLFDSYLCSSTELFNCVIAGSFEWGCHVHWQSRSNCSSARAHHFDYSVSRQ